MIQDRLLTFCTDLDMGSATAGTAVVSSSVPLQINRSSTPQQDEGVDPFGGVPMYLHIHITETYVGATPLEAQVQFLGIVSLTDGGVLPDIASEAQVVAASVNLSTIADGTTAQNQLVAGNHFYFPCGPLSRAFLDFFQDNATLIGFGFDSPKNSGGLLMSVRGLCVSGKDDLAAGKFSADLVDTPGPGVNKAHNFRNSLGL